MPVVSVQPDREFLSATGPSNKTQAAGWFSVRSMRFRKRVFVVGFMMQNREVETKTLPRGIAAWSPERYCCTEQIVI
jgi:hypothetical protein